MDPNIRYFTRISGWSKGDMRPGTKVEVEGHVELIDALDSASDRIAMGDGEHVTVEHLVELRVASKWAGNHLDKLATSGPNYIKLDDDADNEMIHLSDVYGIYNVSYPYHVHGGREGTRAHAERTARYISEQNNIEWGSNFQDVA